MVKLPIYILLYSKLTYKFYNFNALLPLNKGKINFSRSFSLKLVSSKVFIFSFKFFNYFLNNPIIYPKI